LILSLLPLGIQSTLKLSVVVSFTSWYPTNSQVEAFGLLLGQLHTGCSPPPHSRFWLVDESCCYSRCRRGVSGAPSSFYLAVNLFTCCLGLALQLPLQQIAWLMPFGCYRFRRVLFGAMFRPVVGLFCWWLPTVLKSHVDTLIVTVG
jgi:hypothetical protein